MRAYNRIASLMQRDIAKKAPECRGSLPTQSLRGMANESVVQNTGLAITAAVRNWYRLAIGAHIGARCKLY